MSKAPQESLVVYFWFLLTTLLSIQSYTTSGIGLKLLIQIIAKHFPNSIVKNLTSIKTNYSHATDVPLFIWIYGQFVSDKMVNYALTGNILGCYH